MAAFTIGSSTARGGDTLRGGGAIAPPDDTRYGPLHVQVQDARSFSDRADDSTFAHVEDTRTWATIGKGEV